MQNEIFENWTKTTQQAFDSFRKLSEANLRFGEKLWKEQLELTNRLFELTTGNAEEFAKTKDWPEAAGKQAEVAQESGKLVMESCRSCADIVTEASKTYNQLFEQCWKDAEKASNGKRKAA